MIQKEGGNLNTAKSYDDRLDRMAEIKLICEKDLSLHLQLHNCGRRFP
jgi:hypothetical protein